jgi:hypothetical protein
MKLQYNKKEVVYIKMKRKERAVWGISDNKVI